MIKTAILGMSAIALTAAPVAASAAPTAPASKLSLAGSPRAVASTGKGDRLTGAGAGPIAAIAILAGIVVGGYFIIDNHEDDSDSN